MFILLLFYFTERTTRSKNRSSSSNETNTAIVTPTSSTSSTAMKTCIAEKTGMPLSTLTSPSNDSYDTISNYYYFASSTLPVLFQILFQSAISTITPNIQSNKSTNFLPTNAVAGKCQHEFNIVEIML